MLPFIVGEVLITKPDGTVVQVGGNSADKSDGDHTEEDSSTTAHSATPSKHHQHTASDDFPTAVVPVVAIVFTFIWLIIKAIMAPFTQRARRRVETGAGAAAGLSDEEQAVLVKLQRTLTDMENRIESLETILIDEHRTKEKYGTKI